MVRDHLALSLDGSGATIAFEMVMFDQDELGGGLHGWRLWELGRVTHIPDGRGIGGVRLAMPAVSCMRRAHGGLAWDAMVGSHLG